MTTTERTFTPCMRRCWRRHMLLLLLGLLASQVHGKGAGGGGSGSGGGGGAGGRGSTTTTGSGGARSGGATTSAASPTGYRVYSGATGSSLYTGSFAYRTYPTVTILYAAYFYGGGYGYYHYGIPHYRDNTIENCTIQYKNSTAPYPPYPPRPPPSPPSYGSAAPSPITHAVANPAPNEPSGALNFSIFFIDSMPPEGSYDTFYEWNDTMYNNSNGTWWAGDCRVLQYGTGTELGAARLAFSWAVALACLAIALLPTPALS